MSWFFCWQRKYEYCFNVCPYLHVRSNNASELNLLWWINFKSRAQDSLGTMIRFRIQLRRCFPRKLDKWLIELAPVVIRNSNLKANLSWLGSGSLNKSKSKNKWFLLAHLTALIWHAFVITFGENRLFSYFHCDNSRLDWFCFSNYLYWIRLVTTTIYISDDLLPPSCLWKIILAPNMHTCMLV